MLTVEPASVGDEPELIQVVDGMFPRGTGSH